MTHPTEEKGFRLPTHVRPTAYEAEISVDPAARVFSGRIHISLSLAEAAYEIVLHAADLEIENVTVASGGGERTPRERRTVPVSESLVLRFEERLPAGRAVLSLSFRGAISAGLRGMYMAGKGLAATQFEAADARRVFPCFDEPSFKAPWKLTIEAPHGLTVLSNSRPVAQEDRAATRKIAFAETPPLPTYLVALVTGGIEALPEVTVRGVPVRTWATPEKVALTGFAQDVAVEVLPRLEDYFGVPYAFGKLDQVGLPEFEAGAMENAGLITFREVALLLDPATASLFQKKRVAEVITHELAHQWFGNWVTMAWWDDLWLNEAFATWMAFKIVDAWNPGWRVWLEFDQGKAGALQLDALQSTHPIRAEVKSVAEAGEAFDLITYEKGGAVLRMIEGYLGEDRFREGIRLYMRRHAKGNTVADDLWGALAEASREPVVELANAWLRQPGFPIVSVGRQGRTLRLAQRRFFSDPAAEPGTASWPVPMVLRLGRAGVVSERRFLFRGQSAELELAEEPEFVCANAGATGFYRVAYDEAGLSALRRHLPALAPAERIQLLSDEWALVRAGARHIDAFLELCTAFGGESDHAVLDELVARLAVVEHRIVSEPDRSRLQREVADLFRPQLAATGWDPASDEPDAVRLRRAAAVRALGLLARDSQVIAEATARLDRWLSGDRAALEPNLHDLAVTMAARAGNRARFERFQELFRAESDPAFRRRYLLALGAFEEPSLAADALEQLYSPEAVPLQDTAFYVGSLLGNRAGREATWTRLRGAWEPIYRRIQGAPMLTRRVVEALGALVERRHLEEAEAFLLAHPLEEARQAIAQTLERLRQEVALRERAQPTLSRWLRRAR
ncbi:MAG TPA: M1 family metallopeptidase [Anaeromyxobacter sp.]|nr:M1 family metallopeptidase [Anaeromyxobacter sp.]